MCAPDEDVLTLSAEAASRAVAASELENDIIDGLWWGTTRPPFAEGPSHAVLAAAPPGKGRQAICSLPGHAAAPRRLHSCFLDRT